MNYAKRWPLTALTLLFLALGATAGVKVTTLHSFNDSDGYRPEGPLVEAPNGDFYGTTLLGGVHQQGTVFKIRSDGPFTSLISFDRTMGIEPFSGLARGTNGNFYGTTTLGSSDPSVANFGTIFEATPRGKVSTIGSFSETNGTSPYAAPIQGIDGNFYGTTYLGGTNRLGTVFKMTPDGGITTLVTFSGTNGAHPFASSLIEGDDGTLYGTASTGGPDFAPYWDGSGTLFKITLDGSLTTLHNFDGTNGGSPMAFLRGNDGNFYGTTYFGGASNWGTAFKLTPAGDFTILHSFTGQSDGGLATPAMTLDKDGRIYGATTLGGKYPTYGGFGTIFQINTNGEFMTIYLFGTVMNNSHQPLDGSYIAGLTAARDGSIYGTAAYGGAYDNIGNGGHGTVFRLRRVRPVVTISKRDYGASSSQEPITISGAARGVPAVTNVFLSLNKSPWVTATSSNGFRTWSANIIPAPGKNTVHVYAADSAGDISRTNTVNVFCTSLTAGPE